MVYHEKKGKVTLMKTRSVVLTINCLVCSMVFAQSRRQADSPSSETRPRIIATTDGEIDDRCSMVRFLLYANEWDIEGIIYCSSKFHWLGHNWHEVGWIENYIDQYAKFYDNLERHALVSGESGFPTPGELEKKVYVGNIDNVGAMYKDTPGSDRIVEVLWDSKPGPVYLQAWGGTNTIARALWKIQHEHPDQIKKVSKKAIIYIILDQDTTFRKYIEPNWPGIQVLGSFSQFACIAYKWDRKIPSPQKSFFEKPWMEANILTGHGPLCSLYEHRNGAFRSEGDSPAFMHQIRVGLGSMEDPGYGGWGGRFVREKPGSNTWRGAHDDNTTADGDLNKPIWRWAEDFQNDWAARADWCVKSVEEANHKPKAVVNGTVGRSIVRIQAKPGTTVKLSAAGSSDPDGDGLSYRWWNYKEAGSYAKEVKIEDTDTQQASFVVPHDGLGSEFHVILTVRDNGSPNLFAYRRVIVNSPR